MPRHKSRKKKGPKKAWAMLAYIAGDNDLSADGLQDVQYMADEGTSKNIHVGVEIDTKGDHTGSIRYEISEKDWTGKAYKTEIERLPERNSGDPKTLTSFLKWGLGRFNANAYLVVVWGHGSGFHAQVIRRNTPAGGIAPDFSSNTAMDMPAIKDAFRRASINESQPVSVLGFDACLMSMLEIAHHFRGQVKYLVGSQQTSPGWGWPYDQVLRGMKGAKSAEAIARLIVDVYIKDNKARGEQNVTQSAIDVEKTEPAAAALGRLGDALAAGLRRAGPIMQGIRTRTQAYYMADYVDLIHLATQIKKSGADPSIIAAAVDVVRTTNSCIIASKYYGATVKNSHGLSAWSYPPAMDTNERTGDRVGGGRSPAGHIRGPRLPTGISAVKTGRFTCSIHRRGDRS